MRTSLPRPASGSGPFFCASWSYFTFAVVRGRGFVYVRKSRVEHLECDLYRVPRVALRKKARLDAKWAVVKCAQIQKFEPTRRTYDKRLMKDNTRRKTKTVETKKCAHSTERISPRPNWFSRRKHDRCLACAYRYPPTSLARTHGTPSMAADSVVALSDVPLQWLEPEREEEAQLDLIEEAEEAAWEEANPRRLPQGDERTQDAPGRLTRQTSLATMLAEVDAEVSARRDETKVMAAPEDANASASASAAVATGTEPTSGPGAAEVKEARERAPGGMPYAELPPEAATPQTDMQMVLQTDMQTGMQTGMQTDVQTDVQTGMQTNVQTGVQTDSKADSSKAAAASNLELGKGKVKSVALQAEAGVAAQTAGDAHTLQDAYASVAEAAPHAPSDPSLESGDLGILPDGSSVSGGAGHHHVAFRKVELQQAATAASRVQKMFRRRDQQMKQSRDGKTGTEVGSGVSGFKTVAQLRAEALAPKREKEGLPPLPELSWPAKPPSPLPAVLRTKVPKPPASTSSPTSKRSKTPGATGDASSRPSLAQLQPAAVSSRAGHKLGNTASQPLPHKLGGSMSQPLPAPKRGSVGKGGVHEVQPDKRPASSSAAPEDRIGAVAGAAASKRALPTEAAKAAGGHGSGYQHACSGATAAASEPQLPGAEPRPWFLRCIPLDAKQQHAHIGSELAQAKQELADLRAQLRLPPGMPPIALSSHSGVGLASDVQLMTATIHGMHSQLELMLSRADVLTARIGELESQMANLSHSRGSHQPPHTSSPSRAGPAGGGAAPWGRIGAGSFERFISPAFLAGLFSKRSDQLASPHRDGPTPSDATAADRGAKLLGVPARGYALT